MRAQHFGALLFCAQISHHTIPERTCSTQFRYLHEEIHADSEEERKTTGELVYIKFRSHYVEIGRADVRTPVTNTNLVCGLLLEIKNGNDLKVEIIAYHLFTVDQRC